MLSSISNCETTFEVNKEKSNSTFTKLSQESTPLTPCAWMKSRAWDLRTSWERPWAPKQRNKKRENFSSSMESWPLETHLNNSELVRHTDINYTIQFLFNRSLWKRRQKPHKRFESHPTGRGRFTQTEQKKRVVVKGGMEAGHIDHCLKINGCSLLQWSGELEKHDSKLLLGD